MAHYRIGENLYDMDPTTWPPADLKAVKAELGVGVAKFLPLIEDLDPDAIQTLIWIFRRRTEPGLARTDVDFTLQTFMASVEQTDEDIRSVYHTLDFKARDALRESLPDEQRERLFLPDGRMKQEGSLAPLVETT